jgi:rsbT antagonist protein RsbS
MNRLIPIIKYRDFLLVSIQIEVSDRIIQQLKNDIANTIRAAEFRGVVIEVSGVDMIDSYIARAIRDIGQICKLMGVRTVLVGLDPGMAITLVEMGMTMSGVDTALNIEEAVHALESDHLSDEKFLEEDLDIFTDETEIDKMVY